ncbi:putative transcription factor gsfR1 [Trichoderma lentiforme]|uniref:Transcription factor gsfR1 n=1 Tax=Trichoderma lentiforme TaxID=1567552 RepID=A0A9P4XKA8_9HYPO|nr:putative transcription factor gsfR1 [Trichoderma lentiforme]
MAGGCAQARSPLVSDELQSRRRKVRKGTQSCWECKRRKTRCTFVVPTDAVCNGCERRKTACIGQEFPNEAQPASFDSSRKIGIGVRKGLPPLLPRDGREMPGEPRLSATSPASSKFDELSAALFAAWPSKRDFDLILGVPIGISGLYLGAICRPYAGFSCQDAPSPPDMLQLPPPGSHPVLIARKLLMLGLFLQSIPASSARRLVDLGVAYGDIMSCVVEAVVKSVTGDDEFIGSIEHVECIMIESMYQHNMGNLRRSWIALRRAITIAQMMGLHRKSPSLKILELETRSRVNPEHMWLRLVHSDRYLSLMLGLPQASCENNFATPEALESCSPMEYMERIGSVAAGRILQRNSTNIHDHIMTQDIDELLQKSSSPMPAQWWLIPNVTSKDNDDVDVLREINRTMIQFTYYSLLIQLHLPFMLRFSADRKYDYNKIAAVNASRELLVRFASFRSFSHAVSYCRGIDFLAFIASTALCLAHINARYHRRARTDHGDNEGNAVFDFLAHQRLGDRGMMERALESMEYMVRINVDAIASKIASILRQLLAIEADAAIGGSYSTSSSPGGGEEELECHSKVSDGGNVLRIYIPYFGTIKIERRGIYKSATAVLGAPDSDPAVSFDPSLLIERRHEQQPQVATSSPAGYQVGGQSVNPDWQAVPSNFGSLMTPQQSASTTSNNNVLSFDSDSVGNTQLLVPGLTASVDDWALQGVDIAFFDSLLRGAAVPDLAESES